MGNDIVDLHCRDSLDKHRDRRFLDRILTNEEKQRVATADDPHRLLWSFWSAKETAYKVLAKIAPSVSSQPRLYEVWFDSCPDEDSLVEGTVACPGKATIRVRLFSRNYHLHCIGTAGTLNDLDQLHREACSLTDEERDCQGQSSRARNMVSQSVARQLGLEPERFEVIRPKGPRGLLYPRLLLDGRPLAMDISLSHDGAFAGFAHTPCPPCPTCQSFLPLEESLPAPTHSP